MMMTHEEMLALAESMIQAEEAHSPPGQSGWVLGQLKKLYAALEAVPSCACGNRKPLAVIKGIKAWDGKRPVRAEVIILRAKKEAAR